MFKWCGMMGRSVRKLSDRINEAVFWGVLLTGAGVALTIIMAKGMAIAGYDALRQNIRTKSKYITEKFSDKFQKNSDS